MKHSNTTVSSGKLQFAELIKAHFYTPFGVPCEHPLPLPLGEVAERSEDGEGKQKRTAFRRFFQLVDKPSLCGQRFIYAGGARGGKARLESDQMSRKALPCKACVERSDYFRAARRHKNNDIIAGCRKSQRLFRQPEGGAGYPRRPLCRCCEKPVKRIFCRELR